MTLYFVSCNKARVLLGVTNTRLKVTYVSSHPPIAIWSQSINNFEILQFIQKRDPSYDRAKNDSVWTFRKLNEYINTNVAPNKRLQKNWVTRHMLVSLH